MSLSHDVVIVLRRPGVGYCEVVVQSDARGLCEVDAALPAEMAARFWSRRHEFGGISWAHELRISADQLLRVCNSHPGGRSDRDDEVVSTLVA